MTEVETPSAPPFKNRRPGLIGCGIVHLLLALLLFLMCALMVVSLTMMPQGVQSPTPVNVVVYASLLYVALAVFFATLGVGSILGRRWSRPLILITSWGWLLTGVYGGLMYFFIAPRMFDALPPEQAGMKTFMMGCMAVVVGVFGVALPAAFILFYRGKDVKKTVESLDPVPRWTDRVPLPLLAFAIWMFIGAVSVFTSSFMYKALPLGDTMLRGWQSKALLWFFAVFMAWVGWGTLRRIRAAWWSALVLLALGMTYGFAFVARADYAAWYEALGMPADPAQTEMMRAMYSGPFFYVWMGVIWAVYLGFLLYIRRFFTAPETE